MSEKIDKIKIPEEILQICRDFAEVAKKHNLYDFKGQFDGAMHRLGTVHISWQKGRHGEDSNELNVSSTVSVYTTIKPDGSREDT